MEGSASSAKASIKSETSSRTPANVDVDRCRGVGRWTPEGCRAIRALDQVSSTVALAVVALRRRGGPTRCASAVARCAPSRHARCAGLRSAPPNMTLPPHIVTRPRRTRCPASQLSGRRSWQAIITPLWTTHRTPSRLSAVEGEQRSRHPHIIGYFEVPPPPIPERRAARLPSDLSQPP